MIEAWGGILNLVLYAISMLGLGYYTVLTVFSPNTLVSRYDLGEKSAELNLRRSSTTSPFRFPIQEGPAMDDTPPQQMTGAR
jgi:hypothetical protein